VPKSPFNLLACPINCPSIQDSLLKHGKPALPISSNVNMDSDMNLPSGSGKEKHKLTLSLICSQRSQPITPWLTNPTKPLKPTSLRPPKSKSPKTLGHKGTSSFGAYPTPKGINTLSLEPLGTPKLPHTSTSFQFNNKVPALATSPSQSSHALGNLDQQSHNELNDSMINNIRWNPLTIYDWMNKELMNAWSFIFPMTDLSKRDGCLALTTQHGTIFQTHGGGSL